MAHHKSALRYRVEYAVAVSLIALLRWLPLSIARSVATLASRLLDKVIPKLRRAGRTNLAFAFPQWTPLQREHTIDGVFATVGRLLLSFARLPSLAMGNVHQWIRYEGLEHYQAAKAKGKGILVATAHLGNWELSAYTHALMTEPMNVMVRPLDNPLIDRIVEERRTGSGNHLIFKKDAARRVLKALRDNQAVGILMDQNSSAAEGVFVNFFGVQACANVAFAKLAHHSEAAVIPGFAFWDARTGQYILRFYETVPMTGDAQADTQAIHSVLEKIIRQYPDQWMWIHRRWKTRPPGEDSLYE